MNETTPSQLRAEVARILELIRPGVQRDGGDIELVDVDEQGVVSIRFMGACVGCPSSQMTLKMGIERNLKEHVPGVREVIEAQ
jgi:Fe-S cluster biogenesis protein NfuA